MNLNGLKMNFLGDSITAGCCASSPELGFVDILKQKYHLAEARNYGIGGTRIARQYTPSEDPQYDLDFCMRYSDMDPDAGIIVVFGGTNDHGHGDAPFGTTKDRTPYTFCGACHYLFSGLKQKYPHTQIIVLTPLHRVNEECVKNGYTLEDYAKAIQDIAYQHNFPVLDLFHTSKIRANILQIAQDLTTDGLHPNDLGHAILAEEIGTFLEQLQ